VDGRAVVHSRKPAANLPRCLAGTRRPAMRICALDRVRAPSVLDLPGLGEPLASVSASQRLMAHPEGWNPRPSDP
jgi:hypothetical protein